MKDTIKMKKTLIIAVLIGLILFLSCLNKNRHNNNHNYALFIGTNPNNFEDDSSAAASGKNIKGGLMLYINKNPIHYYTGYGEVISINEWIKPKNNSYSIKGFSSENIYLKIAKINHNNQKISVIDKKYIGSGDIEETGFFSSDINYLLPFFMATINDNEKTKNDIKEILFNLKMILETKKSRELYDLLLAGPDLWQPMAYNNNWFELKNNYIKRIHTQYYLQGKQKIEFDINNLKMILGENVVYVYSGSYKNEIFKSHYLFKVKGEKEVIYTPVIKFVRYKSKWIVWEGT
ncbi:hypothetical protein [Desulfosudis oleivorans]|uniref:hypothetical protein n=1 Tax=Desulfosudis oleivorans TaxID=181663 RepID=UPI00129480D1|nr:hypothetical protein [Desulfosudis oleivorans]